MIVRSRKRREEIIHTSRRRRKEITIEDKRKEIISRDWIKETKNKNGREKIVNTIGGKGSWW